MQVAEGEGEKQQRKNKEVECSQSLNRFFRRKGEEGRTFWKQAFSVEISEWNQTRSRSADGIKDGSTEEDIVM